MPYPRAEKRVGYLTQVVGGHSLDEALKVLHPLPYSMLFPLTR